MGWKVWESIPVIACAIIAFISLLRLVQPQIIMDEKQIEQLDKMYSICFNHFMLLDKMWHELENSHKTDDQIANELHELRQSDIMKEYNKLSFLAVRSKPRKLVVKAEKHAHDYFKTNYN